MGQRLVIQIERETEPIANAYYHWSGYTGSALELTDIVVHYLENSPFESDEQKAVYALYKTGARFNTKEIEEIEKQGIDISKYSFVFDNVSADRNEGLLSVSQQGIDESENYAEEMVYIDIKDKTVDFGVIYIENVDEYIRHAQENGYEANLDNLPVLDVDGFVHRYDNGEWKQFLTAMQEAEAKEYNAISPDREIIYEFIA